MATKQKHLYTDLPDYYRCSEPPPVMPSDITGEVVPIDLAARVLAYHETYERVPGWAQYSTMRRNRIKWFDILHDNGLSVKGVDWPDWREYSILTPAGPFRYNVHTRAEWYENVDWDTTRAIIDANYESITGVKLFRLMLETKKMLEVDEHLEIGTVRFMAGLLNLLFIKYILYLQGEDMYNLLLPIYCTIYMKFINVFRLHDVIIEKNKFWLFHSTVHAYPWELFLLDIETFDNPIDWLYVSFGSLWTEIFA